MSSSIPIFSSFSHCTAYPLFTWTMEPDQILKAGPKVFCKGSGDCMSRSFPYFLFPHLFILLFFGKDLCQIVMEENLKYIRGSGVFVYTNFFFLCLFFTKEEER